LGANVSEALKASIYRVNGGYIVLKNVDKKKMASKHKDRNKSIIVRKTIIGLRGTKLQGVVRNFIMR
jgi:hypothetical protein